MSKENGKPEAGDWQKGSPSAPGTYETQIIDFGSMCFKYRTLEWRLDGHWHDPASGAISALDQSCLINAWRRLA